MIVGIVGICKHMHLKAREPNMIFTWFDDIFYDSLLID